MANKHSAKLVTSYQNIILPLLSVAMLLLSMGYAPRVTLAQAAPKDVQVDITGGLPTVTYLPHDCEAYPLAVYEDSITGLQPGDTFNAFAGSASGNFHWVYWNPDPANRNVSYVVTELQNPAVSLNDFTDVFDLTDHSLNNGDNNEDSGC